MVKYSKIADWEFKCQQNVTEYSLSVLTAQWDARCRKPKRRRLMHFYPKEV
jgi:hypothetical protein